MGRLDGKVAVITGGTSGIGRSTTELFVQEGASVVIAARREQEGRRLVEALGARASFVRTDVTREADVEAAVNHAVSRYGRLDCIFNNAGGPVPGGGIESISVEHLDAAMALLLRGVVLGMKHAAPVMKRQGSGSIINTGSIGGLRAGYSFSLAYCAAKAAVIHITRCVAMELGESGVRVNSISPGGIATDLIPQFLGLGADATGQSLEKIKELFRRIQPIPRAGLPGDVAQAAVWLASDESSFVNGHDLVVDGGLGAGRAWTAQRAAVDQMRSAIRPTMVPESPPRTAPAPPTP